MFARRASIPFTDEDRRGSSRDHVVASARSVPRAAPIGTDEYLDADCRATRKCLFPALRVLYVVGGAGRRIGAACGCGATLSRGCPGEPDDPICQTISLPIQPKSLESSATVCVSRPG